MMSFIFSFFLLALSPIIFNSFSSFWFMSISMVIFLAYFSVLNMMLPGLNLLGYSLGLDSLSYSLIFLSFWVSLLMYFSSYSVLLSSDSPKYFSFLIFSLMFILVLTFLGTNYLFFYFMFEASLIPTLLIIVGWGYQPERLQAGVYFLFYTLTVSLPLLLSIVWLFNSINYLDYYLHCTLNMDPIFMFILSLVMSGAFLVKLPMFLTHLWLPKAHVEAPVAGSMILAGVLLKLGGYGLFRLLVICELGLFLTSSILIGLSLLGMFYVGFICCRLNDFKALVAYSSVAHMALVISGIYSYYVWGYNGSLMMMVSHGISSSGLFCIVNMYYERLGSRSFFLNSGLILILPIFSMMLFMLCAANISAPPTINLLSEIFLMGSIMSYDHLMFLIFPLGSFLGAVFTVFMFSYSQHGKIFFTNFSYPVVSLREAHALVLHVIPVNFLVLKTDYFLVVV